MKRSSYKYTDSGIMWLGNIPEHWEVKKFKHYYHSAMGNTILKEELSDEAAIPVYSATEFIEVLGYIDNPNVLLHRDDFIIPARGNSIGHVKLVEEVCTCTQTTIYARRLYPDRIYPYFVYWYQIGLRKKLYEFDNTAIPQLTVRQVKDNPILVPSMEEQKAIAIFLDHETARIDALIRKKEQMVELLKEKRIALITQAVTKGLDPSVPMKDSGIDWLGQVPKHWTVSKFKNFGVFRSGAGFPDDEQGLEDEEIPFYKVSDMNLPGNEIFMREHNNSVSLETVLRLRASIFTRNTIVFAKVGAALLLNKRRILTKNACIDNNMMGFFSQKCDVMWSYFYLYQLDLGKLVNPGAVPSVNESQMSNILVCVPPAQEQKKIGNYLFTETTKINKVIDKVNASIIQLSEYRASLIHHAVTGKIDLRDYDAQVQ